MKSQRLKEKNLRKLTLQQHSILQESQELSYSSKTPMERRSHKELQKLDEHQEDQTNVYSTNKEKFFQNLADKLKANLSEQQISQLDLSAEDQVIFLNQMLENHKSNYNYVSDQQRNLLISLCGNGFTVRRAAKFIKMNYSTAKRIIQKHRKQESQQVSIQASAAQQTQALFQVANQPQQDLDLSENIEDNSSDAVCQKLAAVSQPRKNINDKSSKTDVQINNPFKSTEVIINKFKRQIPEHFIREEINESRKRQMRDQQLWNTSDHQDASSQSSNSETSNNSETEPKYQDNHSKQINSPIDNKKSHTILDSKVNRNNSKKSCIVSLNFEIKDNNSSRQVNSEEKEQQGNVLPSFAFFNQQIENQKAKNNMIDINENQYQLDQIEDSLHMNTFKDKLNTLDICELQALINRLQYKESLAQAALNSKLLSQKNQQQINMDKADYINPFFNNTGH